MLTPIPRATLSARLRYSPDFSVLNFKPSARLRNPVPTFETTPAARSQAIPRIFLSRMRSKLAATINNGMTKLTTLHHACRTESPVVHFSLSTVLSTSEHRNKKRPKLTTGGSQKRQLSTEARELP